MTTASPKAISFARGEDPRGIIISQAAPRTGEPLDQQLLNESPCQASAAATRFAHGKETMLSGRRSVNSIGNIGENVVPFSCLMRLLIDRITETHQHGRVPNLARAPSCNSGIAAEGPAREVVWRYKETVPHAVEVGV